MHPAGQRPAVQRQFLRLRLRHHLQGGPQGGVRAGAQLLLLPRGGGRLSPGRSAKRPERHARQAAPLYFRHSGAVWPCPGAADLRLPLPLRAHPGAAPQAPREKDQEKRLDPSAVLAEICGIGGIRHRHPPVVRLHRGLPPARLLQIYLPRRHPGGRYSPGGPPGDPAPYGGVAVHLENRPVRRYFAPVRILLPGLLPLSLPPGSHLLPFQPGGPAGLPGGRRQVRRLRPLHPQMSDGR